METKPKNAKSAAPGGLPDIEAVELTSEDLSLAPPRFATNGKPARLVTGWVWGWGHLQGPGGPLITHLREHDSEKTKRVGVIQLGASPQTRHTALHCGEFYPEYGPWKYVEVNGDPEGHTNDKVTYEQRAPESAGMPRLLYRYSSKRARIIEGNFLDVTYEYMPYAMVSRERVGFGVPYIHQHAIIQGTYMGKPVRYLGGWDRMYGGEAFEGVFTSLEGRMFAGLSFAGVRPNGQREWGMVSVIPGRPGIGYYCKDGEEPITTSEVTLDATWEPLRFANDKTMVFTKATFRFGNKTIHYVASLGMRGHSCTITEWPGFAQTSGIWYEGDTPTEFAMSMSYAESHHALEGKV